MWPEIKVEGQKFTTVFSDSMDFKRWIPPDSCSWRDFRISWFLTSIMVWKIKLPCINEIIDAKLQTLIS